MSIVSFPEAARQMKAYSWQQLVDRAQSEAEVLTIARDFLSSLDHFEIARLPDRLRPRKLFGAGDLASYALDLARHHTDEFEVAGPVVHRMAAFFVHANIRLSQILTRTNDEDGQTKERA